MKKRYAKYLLLSAKTIIALSPRFKCLAELSPNQLERNLAKKCSLFPLFRLPPITLTFDWPAAKRPPDR